MVEKVCKYSTSNTSNHVCEHCYWFINVLQNMFTFKYHVYLQAKFPVLMTSAIQRAIFIDRVALAKQGDNRIDSIRPSVRPSVNALTAEPFGL